MANPKTFAGSARGLIRPENEDSFLLHVPDDKSVVRRKGILAAVADGVGGGPAGKQASSLAVITVKESYYGDPTHDSARCLAMAFHEANHNIVEESSRSVGVQGMSTTCTAVVCKGNKGYVCHAGDSRAYFLRDKVLHQLTRDHSLVNEMIREGIITPDEALHHPQRNVILKALGSSPRVEPDLCSFDIEHGDTVLLSSDGLHGYVSDREISAILSEYSAEKAGPKLIELSLEKGGHDNVTVIILRF
jgi:serine/threonine protein phosphatase PrpC